MKKETSNEIACCLLSNFDYFFLLMANRCVSETKSESEREFISCDLTFGSLCTVDIHNITKRMIENPVHQILIVSLVRSRHGWMSTVRHEVMLQLMNVFLIGSSVIFGEAGFIWLWWVLHLHVIAPRTIRNNKHFLMRCAVAAFRSIFLSGWKAIFLVDGISNFILLSFHDIHGKHQIDS